MEKLNVIAITQARMSSTRLPGKVLMTINNESMLSIHFKRVSKSKLISKHVLATSTTLADTTIEKFAHESEITVFRGDEDNVLKRFIDCLSSFDKVDYVVRLTADCPLIDAEVIDDCIRLIDKEKLDYVSNCVEPTFPDGMDVEVFTYQSLLKAFTEAILNSDKEHVTPYIWRNSTIKGGVLFNAKTLKHTADYSSVRLTVDEQSDFDLIESLIAKFGTDAPWLTYANDVIENKIISNQSILRNEGYLKSLKKD